MMIGGGDKGELKSIYIRNEEVNHNTLLKVGHMEMASVAREKKW